MELKNKTFCITGSFNVKRSSIVKALTSLGAIYSTTLDTKTSFLIIGEDAGSKEIKARGLNIPVLNLDQLKGL